MLGFDRAEKARMIRRGVPIMAYVGPNGGGKSLLMVHDTLPTLAGVTWRCANPAHEHTGRGVIEGLRRVLSTVRLIDEDGNDHPLYVRLVDYRQLLVAEHCDVLFDEVTGIASAREGQSLPPQVANWLVQLRRRDVLLRWTSPNWLRADRIIREVSQGVTLCRGYMPEKAQDGRLWRPRRLFLINSYDRAAFDEFAAHRREDIKAQARQIYRRANKPAQHAYDTLDSVESLGVANEGGMCITCGGKRSMPRCSCSNNDESVDVRPVHVRRPGRRLPSPLPVEA